jgi:hypothetical protein
MKDRAWHARGMAVDRRILRDASWLRQQSLLMQSSCIEQGRRGEHDACWNLPAKVQSMHITAQQQAKTLIRATGAADPPAHTRAGIFAGASRPIDPIRHPRPASWRSARFSHAVSRARMAHGKQSRAPCRRPRSGVALWRQLWPARPRSCPLPVHALRWGDLLQRHALTAPSENASGLRQAGHGLADQGYLPALRESKRPPVRCDALQCILDIDNDPASPLANTVIFGREITCDTS